MKIDVLIKKFLGEQEVYNRVDTIKYDKAHINVITQYLDKNGIANVEEITKNVVFNYMKQSMDDGLKNSSINKNVVMLKRLVKYADDNGYLDDLAQDIRAELKKVEGIKKLKDDCESYDSLDSNQIGIYQDYVKKMKISDTLSLRNKIMFTLFMECGMRRTELALIETKDVDLANKTIRLAHVKANKPRNVYLSDGAVYLLSLFIPNHTHKYLFVSYQTGEHMTLAQKFLKYKKKVPTCKLSTYENRFFKRLEYLID